MTVNKQTQTNTHTRHAKRTRAQQSLSWAEWAFDLDSLGLGNGLVTHLEDLLADLFSVEQFLTLVENHVKLMDDDAAARLKGRNSNAVLMLQLRDLVLRFRSLEFFEMCTLFDSFSAYLKGSAPASLQGLAVDDVHSLVWSNDWEGATETGHPYGKYVAALQKRDGENARRWFAAYSESPEVTMTFAQRSLQVASMGYFLNHRAAAQRHIKVRQFITRSNPRLMLTPPTKTNKNRHTQQEAKNAAAESGDLATVKLANQLLNATTPASAPPSQKSTRQRIRPPKMVAPKRVEDLVRAGFFFFFLLFFC